MQSSVGVGWLTECDMHLTQTHTCLCTKCDIGSILSSAVHHPYSNTHIFRLSALVSVCVRWPLSAVDCCCSAQSCLNAFILCVQCLCWHTCCIHGLVDRLIECLRVYSQNKSHFNTEWTMNAEHSVSVILTCTCLTHCILLIALVNIRRAKEKSYDKLIVRYTNTRTYTHTHMCLIACACISLVIYRYIVKSKMLNTHWLITNDTQTYFCKIAHRSHTPQQRKKRRLLCVFSFVCAKQSERVQK